MSLLEKEKMRNMHLVRINAEEAPAPRTFDDYTVYQTDEWLKFIEGSQDAEPVYALVKCGEQTIGRFAGLIINRYGISILGSPFPGWTTSYMGFNLVPSFSRIEALLALKEFAFDDLKCMHMEIMDRRIPVEDVQQLGCHYTLYRGFEIDLTSSENEIFSAMEPACRRCIRKAEKIGVQLEQARDVAFIDDYYNQLVDVFAKKKLVPTYPKERVKRMVEVMLATENLLLVRARHPNGVCIATGIFPAANDTMFFWGGASYRNYQILRPNEALMWYAMRYWKSKGIQRYDLGGAGEYKRKYGGHEIAIPWIRMSKTPVIEYLRNGAQAIFAIRQQILGLAKR
jgi:hypothetical protein